MVRRYLYPMQIHMRSILCYFLSFQGYSFLWSLRIKWYKRAMTLTMYRNDLSELLLRGFTSMCLPLKYVASRHCVNLHNLWEVETCSGLDLSFLPKCMYLVRLHFFVRMFWKYIHIYSWPWFLHLPFTCSIICQLYHGFI